MNLGKFNIFKKRKSEAAQASTPNASGSASAHTPTTASPQACEDDDGDDGVGREIDYFFGGSPATVGSTAGAGTPLAAAPGGEAAPADTPLGDGGHAIPTTAAGGGGAADLGTGAAGNPDGAAGDAGGASASTAAGGAVPAIASHPSMGSMVSPCGMSDADASGSVAAPTSPYAPTPPPEYARGATPAHTGYADSKSLLGDTFTSEPGGGGSAFALRPQPSGATGAAMCRHASSSSIASSRASSMPHNQTLSPTSTAAASHASSTPIGGKVAATKQAFSKFFSKKATTSHEGDGGSGSVTSARSTAATSATRSMTHRDSKNIIGRFYLRAEEEEDAQLPALPSPSSDRMDQTSSSPSAADDQQPHVLVRKKPSEKSPVVGQGFGVASASVSKVYPNDVVSVVEISDSWMRLETGGWVPMVSDVGMFTATINVTHPLSTAGRLSYLTPAFSEKCRGFYLYYAPEKLASLDGFLAEREGDATALRQMWYTLTTRYGPYPVEGLAEYVAWLRPYYGAGEEGWRARFVDPVPVPVAVSEHMAPSETTSQADVASAVNDGGGAVGEISGGQEADATTTTTAAAAAAAVAAGSVVSPMAVLRTSSGVLQAVPSAMLPADSLATLHRRRSSSSATLPAAASGNPAAVATRSASSPINVTAPPPIEHVVYQLRRRGLELADMQADPARLNADDCVLLLLPEDVFAIAQPYHPPVTPPDMGMDGVDEPSMLLVGCDMSLGGGSFTTVPTQSPEQTLRYVAPMAVGDAPAGAGGDAARTPLAEGARAASLEEILAMPSATPDGAGGAAADAVATPASAVERSPPPVIPSASTSVARLSRPISTSPPPMRPKPLPRLPVGTLVEFNTVEQGWREDGVIVEFDVAKDAYNIKIDGHHMLRGWKRKNIRESYKSWNHLANEEMEKLATMKKAAQAQAQQDGSTPPPPAWTSADEARLADLTRRHERFLEEGMRKMQETAPSPRTTREKKEKDPKKDPGKRLLSGPRLRQNPLAMFGLGARDGSGAPAPGQGPMASPNANSKWTQKLKLKGRAAFGFSMDPTTGSVNTGNPQQRTGKAMIKPERLLADADGRALQEFMYGQEVWGWLVEDARVVGPAERGTPHPLADGTQRAARKLARRRRQAARYRKRRHHDGGSPTSAGETGSPSVGRQDSPTTAWLRNPSFDLGGASASISSTAGLNTSVSRLLAAASVNGGEKEKAASTTAAADTSSHAGTAPVAPEYPSSSSEEDDTAAEYTLADLQLRIDSDIRRRLARGYEGAPHIMGVWTQPLDTAENADVDADADDALLHLASVNVAAGVDIDAAAAPPVPAADTSSAPAVSRHASEVLSLQATVRTGVSSHPTTAFGDELGAGLPSTIDADGLAGRRAPSPGPNLPVSSARYPKLSELYVTHKSILVDEWRDADDKVPPSIRHNAPLTRKLFRLTEMAPPSEASDFDVDDTKARCDEGEVDDDGADGDDAPAAAARRTPRHVNVHRPKTPIPLYPFVALLEQAGPGALPLRPPPADGITAPPLDVGEPDQGGAEDGAGHEALPWLKLLDAAAPRPLDEVAAFYVAKGHGDKEAAAAAAATQRAAEDAEADAAVAALNATHSSVPGAAAAAGGGGDHGHDMLSISVQSLALVDGPAGSASGVDASVSSLMDAGAASPTSTTSRTSRGRLDWENPRSPRAFGSTRSMKKRPQVQTTSK